MAAIKKGSNEITLYKSSPLPMALCVYHNQPGLSYMITTPTSGMEMVDSTQIKKMIDEAESLKVCLRRILIAQQAAENKLKPKSPPNQYAVEGRAMYNRARKLAKGVRK